MSATLKPRLDRTHVLDLLRHMIRIRRFEDKCAELYTQEKIRGFLHLYIGEEAVLRIEVRNAGVETWRRDQVVLSNVEQPLNAEGVQPLPADIPPGETATWEHGEIFFHSAEDVVAFSPVEK